MVFYGYCKTNCLEKEVCQEVWKEKKEIGSLRVVVMCPFWEMFNSRTR